MGHWNRVSRVKSRTKAMFEGWTAEAASLPESYWVNGESLTAGDIVGRLERCKKAHDQVAQCRTLLAFAIARRDEQLEAEQRLQENLTALLHQALGATSPRLRKFGLAPPKARRPLTAEELVVAQQRSKDTRRARGTQGSKQREAITTEAQPTLVIAGLGPVLTRGTP